MKRFFSRIGRGILHCFLRHWAGAAIVLLLLLAAFTGYQMWRLGPVMALSLLPQLILCLALVVAVVAVRRFIKALTTKNVVESGVAQGRATRPHEDCPHKDTKTRSASLRPVWGSMRGEVGPFTLRMHAWEFHIPAGAVPLVSRQCLRHLAFGRS